MKICEKVEFSAVIIITLDSVSRDTVEHFNMLIW